MALGVHPAGRLLNYEQYIEHQIRRTRSRIKEIDMLTAGLTLATAALGILFLEVVLDHAIGMPLWLRRAIAWSGVSSGGAYAVLRIALPLFGRVSVFYAAKTIEDADPSFKNSLTTYLDLRRRRGQVSRAAFEAVEARAVKDLVKVEIDGVIDRGRLLRRVYALSGLVVVSCLNAAVSPRSFLDSARRALLADVARPTRTRLAAVRPGDLRIVSGDDVRFSVEVRGTRPDLVALHYRAHGDDDFSTAALAPGPSESAPWQATLRSVRQELDYYLTAGDARSRRHHIKVLPAPLITSVRVDLIAPPYTGIAPRMDVDGDMIEAIEGTVVNVRARTNEPAASAHFEFDLGEGRWDRDSAIEVSGADARLLLGRFTVSRSGTYRIGFQSTGGRVNPDPAVSEILALRDRPPTVRFVHPTEPDLTVPRNLKVPLVMTADDDYGVKDALLTVRQGNETLATINLLEGRRPTGRFTGTFTIDLAKAEVSSGTADEYWLSVRDTKEPIANRTESRRRMIRIAGPVAPEERRAIKAKAEREKAEAETSGGMAERVPLPGDQNRRPDPGARAGEVAGESKKAAGAPPPVGNPGDDPPETVDRPQLGPDQIARLEEILNSAGVRDGRQAPRTSSPPGTGSTTHPGPASGQDAGGRHERPAEPIANDLPGADSVAHAPRNPSAGSPPSPGPPGARSDPAPSARAKRPTRPAPDHGPDSGDDAPPDGNVQAVMPAAQDGAGSSDLREGGPGKSNSPATPLGETEPSLPSGRKGGPQAHPGATKTGKAVAGAKGTWDQQPPAEVTGWPRDADDGNHRPDQAGGKAPRGGQADEATRPDSRPGPSPDRGRSSQGAAASPGGENARGKRPAVDDARRDPEEQAKPEAIDARRQVEQPASKALTGEATRDEAGIEDEPKGPEKAKSIPPTREKTTEKEKLPVPPRDPPRGLGQPPSQQAPESRRGPRSPDAPRRPERKPSGESPPPGAKKEPPPVVAGQPGETESGVPAGMPGPAGQKPSQVPHDNSSSPGRNANGPNASKPARPRSQQPASSRPKPRDQSASPPRDRSLTSKPAPPRDEQSATPARPSTTPRESGHASGLSGSGHGPGAGGRAAGSSSGRGGSPADRDGAAPSGEPGESGRTTTRDPSGPPADAGEPSDPSRGAGSLGATTHHPGTTTDRGTTSRSSSGPGADDSWGVPPSPLGRSSGARSDPDGRPPEQSDGDGPPRLPPAKQGLRRGGDREVSAGNVASRNQRQTQRVLRQLRDLIDNDQVPREVLAALGVRSNEELDQFVSRFERAPQSRPGPGRTIESRPGDPPDSPPDLLAPAPETISTAGIQSLRHRGAFVDDAIRGNLEGPRFIPPPELRARFDAYRATVGQSRTPNP